MNTFTRTTAAIRSLKFNPGKLAIVALTVFGLGLSSAFATPVSTGNVLKRVIVLTGLEEALDHQVLAIQVDNISRGKTDTHTYRLQKGVAYSIKVVGDHERIQDIDVKVKDSNGRLVGIDRDASNVGIINFTSQKSGLFKIEVSAYRMSHRDGFYGIVVSRTGNA